MEQITALRELAKWDATGRYVYRRGDLHKLFPEANKTFDAGLRRLVDAGILVHACRGVYVFAFTRNDDGNTLARIALALRRGEYNYLSLEAALSRYGAISQVPVDRETVMTTGRKGEYTTPWGVIEFTHTKRSVPDILENTTTGAGPLRLARPAAAWRDLKRVGRNTHLVDTEVLDGINR